jgi:hypothetical protein
MHVRAVLNQEWDHSCETELGRESYCLVITSMHVGAVQQEELHHVRIEGHHQCAIVVSMHIGVVL